MNTHETPSAASPLAQLTVGSSSGTKLLGAGSGAVQERLSLDCVLASRFICRSALRALHPFEIHCTTRTVKGYGVSSLTVFVNHVTTWDIEFANIEDGHWLYDAHLLIKTHRESAVRSCR